MLEISVLRWGSMPALLSGSHGLALSHPLVTSLSPLEERWKELALRVVDWGCRGTRAVPSMAQCEPGSRAFLGSLECCNAALSATAPQGGRGLTG